MEIAERTPAIKLGDVHSPPSQEVTRRLRITSGLHRVRFEAGTLGHTPTQVLCP